MCEQCDKDIHPKRLAAIPWAALCIRCQETLDRNPEQISTPVGNFLADAA
jgi:RNA polymerase-binding transcription factor DksA